MALDEPSDGDERFEQPGILLVAGKDIIEQFGGVVVDYRSNPWGGGGFIVKPAVHRENACGDCSC